MQLGTLIRSPVASFGTQFLAAPRRVVVIAAWLLGVAHTIERTGSRLSMAMMAEFVAQPDALAGRPSVAFARYISDSWLSFAAWCGTMGIVGGVLHWYLGGWLYRVRLRLCGVSLDTPEPARCAVVYAGLFWSVPFILYHLLMVPWFGSYAAAFEVMLIDVVRLPFLAVSTLVSFFVALLHFRAPPLRAAVWFLVLPMFFLIGVPCGGGLVLAGLALSMRTGVPGTE